VQSYVYDDANRVVGQVFTDGSQVGFSYDANGNVTSVTPRAGRNTTFGYTPADLMSSYTPPAVAGTGATTYEYNLDKQPRVVHRRMASQIVFGYDGAGRLSTVTYPKGPDVSDGTGDGHGDVQCEHREARQCKTPATGRRSPTGTTAHCCYRPHGRGRWREA